MGDISTPEPVLVRMHASNPLDDMLGLRPGRASQLGDAMTAIAKAGRGAVVLLRDMSMKLDLDGAPSPQTLRQYGLGAQILAALGIHELIIMSQTDTHHQLPTADVPKGTKLLIVRAPYYKQIGDDLLTGAEKAITDAGAAFETLDVPGALEIPTAISIAASSNKFDGFVALVSILTLHNGPIPTRSRP